MREGLRKSLPLENVVIDHVAVAVHDTADALRLYVDTLGFEAEQTDVVPAENIRVTFVNGRNARLEVIEPLTEDSAVGRFLAKRGEGIHHICLEVVDLPSALERLRAAGYQLVDDVPRQGFHGKLLAFVHPKSTNGVMIELYERS